MNRECFTDSGKPKVRYVTRTEAKHTARQFDQSQQLRAYRCAHCGYFHLGHYPSSSQARRALRRRHRYQPTP